MQPQPNVRSRRAPAPVRTAARVALLVALAAPAQAQVPRRDTTVFRVGEIVVQAARPVTTTGGASAIEVRLDSMALPPAPTLEQVLRELPMVHVRTNSRGEAEIAVRGSESRQVAVLVDGVPLTLGWDARADVSVVPATAARQLTLVRGLSSVLYGPNVLGGIIEVGIGHGSVAVQRRAEFGAGLDHTGGYSASATVSAPVQLATGAFMVRAGAGFRDSPGVPLAHGVTEPAPGGNELRLNTDARQLDGFIALRRDFDSGRWLSAAASGYTAVRGIAAELGVDEPRLWRYPSASRLIAVLSGGTPQGASPFGGSGDVEASLGVDLGRTEIDQYASRAYDELIGAEDGDDRTLTLRLRADNTLGEQGALQVAATLADITHDELLVPGGAATYRQRLWSVGSEVTWRRDAPFPGVDNLRASLGGVVDGADTPESGDKPALGALAEWGARLGVTAAIGQGRALVHAGVSRRARFPALRELYSGALGRFEPNPFLEAERLIAAEAGVTTRITRGEVQVVAFRHQLSDAIVRTRTTEGRFQRVNQNRITSSGVELMGALRVHALSLSADLTVQDVDLDDPTAPGARPENQPRVFGGAQARLPLAAGVAAGVGARFTGEQYCIDPQSGEYRGLPAAGRFDAELAREWRIGTRGGWLSRLEVRLAVDNLADAATYDMCALPQPGRLARIQLRLF